MDKLITKILRESGTNARITKDSKKPKFRVTDNKLTLEGIVTNKKYSMKIVNEKGDIIDELSVAVNDGNDIANRINESINTLHKLSPIYDNQVKLKEDEEFEDLPEAEPGDKKGAIHALTDIYNTLMNLAESTKKISDYYEEDDVKNRDEIISFVSSIYDVAIDIDKFIEDIVEELESEAEELANSQVESFKRKPKLSSKTAIRNALNSITMAEAYLQNQTTLSDIKNAVKDIKAELTLRGK